MNKKDDPVVKLVAELERLKKDLARENRNLIITVLLALVIAGGVAWMLL